MGNFQVQLNKNGDKADIVVSGKLDEDAILSQYDIATAKEIHMNVEALTQINSCGVREWIKWIGSTQGIIYLYNCQKAFVEQSNMVLGFLPKTAVIKSLYVPYFSDETEESKQVLFEYGKHYTETELNLPEGVKDSQGNEMEVDVLPDKYFRFLKKK